MDGRVTSIIDIKINEFSEKYVNDKIVTFYKIEVYDISSKENWEVDKRYSEIDSLHKTISKLHPDIPPMPGKTFFKLKDKEKIEKRKKQLEFFLNECAKKSEILSNADFKKFLELDQHSPDLTIDAPQIIYENNELTQGVRDFVYFEEGQILYIVCSDMKIASRFGSYVKNLPKDKKNAAHNSVGSVIAYKINHNKEQNSYNFEKIWNQSFPEQTGVVNFDKDNYFLQVGLDYGTVIFYKTTLESKFLNYEEYCRIKPHNGRVMGLDFDPKQEYIYSCGSDKKFILSEINYLCNTTEISESNAGYTNLIFDKVNGRLFLTNETGILSVFVTKTSPPSIVYAIQTTAAHCIRGLEINFSKQYIFTGTIKGDISILDLGKPGKEESMNEVSYFHGNLEIRIIRYNEEDSEIYIGDQKGRITIWNLSGQLTYIWQAHSDAITQMKYFPETRQLLSMAKDKKIIYWQMPEKKSIEPIKLNKQNKSAKKSKEENKKEKNDTKEEEEKETTEKKENDDGEEKEEAEEDEEYSDNDDLNGWCRKFKDL